MSVHTKKRPTKTPRRGLLRKHPHRSVPAGALLSDERLQLVFVGPAAHAECVRDALHAWGFEEVRDTVPWRECFPEWTDAALPGIALAGARHKEGLTQVQLAGMTGIPQRHISEMEHGKRPIGKELAKKLAEVVKVDYRILL
jgi:DNA-binding XRE family transcriptional regulator